MLLSTFLLAFLCSIHSPAWAAVISFDAHNASLLWGPYRPNLYLGIRPRVPDNGLMAGLMWGSSENVYKKLRHNVDMSEGMARYGWTRYDTRNGGRQIIEDVGNKIDITTEFTKNNEGQNSGSWGLRIKGVPRNNAPADLKTTVIFYISMEAMQSCPDCKLESREERGAGGDTPLYAINFDMSHPKLGDAGIHIPVPTLEDGQKGDLVVKALSVSEDKLWQAKAIFLDAIKKQMKDQKEAISSTPMLHSTPGSGNIHFVQLTCSGKFELDILYSSRTASHAMTSSGLTQDLESATKSFAKRFSHVFGPKKPFTTNEHLKFSENALSNLLGGLGYFVGTTKVGASKKVIFAETSATFWEKSEEARKHINSETRGPFELLTHTPSRATFPRGVLWDEGFHLLLVLEWDADLAVEVIRSWLALVDDDGWIACQQILGPEAESATPEDFIMQLPHIATPPTMFLVVSNFADMLVGKMKYYGRESIYLSKKDKGEALLAEIYPALKKHYEWFRRSQAGDVEAHSVPSADLNEGYRWRGRTPETNSASGMDDFPRAEPPNVSELHLDALCWVGMMARTLERISGSTKTKHESLTYQRHIRGIKDNLVTLHWVETQTMYCDSLVEDGVHRFTCHKGYVSLMPFLTGLLGPDHEHLPAVLHLLHNPNHLWTDYGIRSLSPESKKYGVGDNYWRSPIWVNINYLALTQLLSLARTPGPSQKLCRQIYIELRRNIVNTVFTSWKETGYFWEQYDPGGGHGQRSLQFTGWTALVVKIMAMPDLEQSEGVKDKMKEYYDQAKMQAMQNQKSGAGSMVFTIILVAFLYATRRRFAGTIRSWRTRTR